MTESRGADSEAGAKDDVWPVLQALEASGARYVLIGAVALTAQGLPRLTQDVDIFIPIDAENLERIKSALWAVYQDPAIEEIRCEDLESGYPTIRYGPPTGDMVIDLISRLGETLAFQDVESEVLVIDGVRVRVATPRALYRMKKDTGRPKDRVDAEALKRKFALED
jgi:hypothetical protein